MFTQSRSLTLSQSLPKQVLLSLWPVGINRIVDVVDYLGCAQMQRVSTRRLLCMFLFKILEGAGDMALLLRATNVLS